MDSTILPKSSIITKSTSDIPANHPLTKNMNNLSSLIKSKDSHHHHHHHSSTNKNLTQTASSMTREDLHMKYQTFLQLSFEIILQQLRDLKLSKSQTSDFLQYLFDQSLHEQNKNIEHHVRLAIYLQKNSFITNHQCLQVLTNILSKIQDYEKQIALFKSELATLIANIIWACLTNEQEIDQSTKSNGNSKKSPVLLLSFNDVCELLKDGQHHPLFLLLLQQLQQLFNNDEQYM